MSYAIIRNAKYTINNLNGIYRHNERKNTNYSNKDITKEKAINNYSLKNCNMPYSKAFRKIKEENNLQGWIKKNSNVACEYIITSDKEFFENIGEEETKRYFKTAFEFVKNYKDLGEKYILSAKVHNDESTPHLHQHAPDARQRRLLRIPARRRARPAGEGRDAGRCRDRRQLRHDHLHLGRPVAVYDRRHRRIHQPRPS